jgi:hypothetical protein
MKFFIKKIYFILFFLTIMLSNLEVLANSSENKYTRHFISNYFSGVVFAEQNYNRKALSHLEKIQSIKDKHSRFSSEYLRTLIILDKFKEAKDFAKHLSHDNEFFFEADLILGLDLLLKQDYKKAEKHFKRLNRPSIYNLFYQDFFGNILLSWSKASEGKKAESLEIFERIPDRYKQLKKIQNSFLQCYFDTNKTESIFRELIQDKEYNFSRYNFFLANYFVHKNDLIKGKKVIEASRKLDNSNLLLKQTEIFFKNKKEKKIKDVFNCKEPKDAIAEFFYIIANLYASEQDYKLSNFYLKFSLFLNKSFLMNKTLLAENYYYQEKYELSKKIYDSLKTIGETYSWYASTSVASILLKTNDKEFSIKFLEKDFNSLSSPSFENYYELANFYKDNEYFEKSINFYTLALKNLPSGHPLIVKIFDRRGTSYERIGEWEKAEKDLLKSLEILPEQAHVLNYLAYTWIDKGINLDKGLKMLDKAMKLRVDDGYITDSIGWAYYIKKNYLEAEKYLQRAVELLPTDPTINDHYADTLWMLNKNIQARYFWNYVLNLENIKVELKDNISKKLIFGIKKL